MSKKRELDSFEVGYGKPPKDTQFKKGVSGNPTGRPKKPADFHAQLIREANSFITIIENGRRVRMSKSEGIAKQVTNKALQGDPRAQRNFLIHYSQALEKVALASEKQAKELKRYKSAEDLTDDQLAEIIWRDQEDMEKKEKK